MQRVKIVNKHDGIFGTECYIDGKKLNRVISAGFHISVGEVPTFTFETIGLPDIDMAGDVRFRFTPDTAKDAYIVLKKEFKENPDSYKALVRSIAFVIQNTPEEFWSVALAKAIADHIFGLEK